MDEYLHTFVSTSDSCDSTVLFFSILSILIFISLVIYFFKSELNIAKKIRSPFTLLLLTSALVTASIAFYTYESTFELDKVIITNNSVITPFGPCKFTNIKDASFINVLPDGKKDSTQFLLIEEYTGKAHPINGNNYDITSIMKELEKHLPK